jgi:hypothetical protein
VFAFVIDFFNVLVVSVKCLDLKFVLNSWCNFCNGIESRREMNFDDNYFKIYMLFVFMALGCLSYKQKRKA